jgi:hypothetical protein
MFQFEQSKVYRVLRRLVTPLSMVFTGGAVLATSGCSELFGGGGLELAISVSDSTISPDAPVVVTVTAMNLGDSVIWGQGSSSCQLHAVVWVGSAERRIDYRACTDDLAPQGLGPDESRTEKWMWGGEALGDQSFDTLPPGDYQIQAVAGDAKRSRPLTVQVSAASGN